MARVFHDSGPRVRVSQTTSEGLLLVVGEQEVDLVNEELARRVIEAIQQGLAGLQTEDARDL